MSAAKPMRWGWLAFVLLIGLGGYWAGVRWGARAPAAARANQPLPPSPPEQEALTPEETVNVRIYHEVSPWVANIITRAVQYDFFLDPIPVEGAGSGFVIDASGHILTNYHVIAGATSIAVALGESHFTANLVGGDQRNDIALLQITPGGHKLVPLAFGDAARLQVGQRVLAIGNPFGFQSTLTTGVVSALGRTVQTGPDTFIENAIQTDAPINRGNSGGPLLDTQGRVVGINAAIYAPGGTEGITGIGFAIPINTARRVVDDLLRYGHVRRASLGISRFLPLWPSLAQALGISATEGLLVEEVQQGSPAEQAGIRGGNRMALVGLQRILIGGDVLVAVNGEKVSSQMDLELALNQKQPGERVTLTIERNNRDLQIRVTLGG